LASGRPCRRDLPVDTAIFVGPGVLEHKTDLGVSVQDLEGIGRWTAGTFRPEPPDQLLVHHVQGPALGEAPAHPIVHLGARQARIVDLAVRDPGFLVGFPWVVALVRNTDERVHQPKGADDLGCGWQ
jgi:hypothetical protein